VAKLLDTFLINSISDDNMKTLVGHAIQFRFPIRILMLYPLGPFAKARAKFVRPEAKQAHAAENAREKAHEPAALIAESLRLIARAVAHAAPGEISSAGLEVPPSWGETLNDVIDAHLHFLAAVRERGVVDLEVKFYNEQTEAPAYLVGCFLAKGLIFPGQSASTSPWMIFVDDSTQQRDIYDVFSSTFDSIWESPGLTFDRIGPGSQPVRESGRNDIFIIHGHNEVVRDAVARAIGEMDLNPRILNTEAGMSATIIERIEQTADAGEVAHAIAVWTHDDTGASVKDVGGRRSSDTQSALHGLRPRARQNVLVETGFFMGRLGRKGVTILYEEGVEIPSDLHGVSYIALDAGGEWRTQLRKELKARRFDVAAP
jgi:predicted nucleotide-binding protein